MIFCPTSNAVISDQDLNIDVNIPRQMSWSNYCGIFAEFSFVAQIDFDEKLPRTLSC